MTKRQPRDIELVRACAWCRRVQTEANEWQELEAYLRRRFGIDFTHGICPPCLRLHAAGDAPSR